MKRVNRFLVEVNKKREVTETIYATHINPMDLYALAEKLNNYHQREIDISISDYYNACSDLHYSHKNKELFIIVHTRDLFQQYENPDFFGEILCLPEDK